MKKDSIGIGHFFAEFQRVVGDLKKEGMSDADVSRSLAVYKLALDNREIRNLTKRLVVGEISLEEAIAEHTLQRLRMGTISLSSPEMGALIKHAQEANDIEFFNKMSKALAQGPLEHSIGILDYFLVAFWTKPFEIGATKVPPLHCFTAEALLEIIRLILIQENLTTAALLKVIKRKLGLVNGPRNKVSPTGARRIISSLKRNANARSTFRIGLIEQLDKMNQ